MSHHRATLLIKHARNSEIFRHSGSTVGKLKRLAAAVSAKIAELSRWDVLESNPRVAALLSYWAQVDPQNQ